jgi:hypothetical protein
MNTPTLDLPLDLLPVSPTDQTLPEAIEGMGVYCYVCKVTLPEHKVERKEWRGKRKIASMACNLILANET